MTESFGDTAVTLLLQCTLGWPPVDLCLLQMETVNPYPEASTGHALK